MTSGEQAQEGASGSGLFLTEPNEELPHCREPNADSAEPKDGKDLHADHVLIQSTLQDLEAEAAELSGVGVKGFDHAVHPHFEQSEATDKGRSHNYFNRHNRRKAYGYGVADGMLSPMEAVNLIPPGRHD